MPWAKFDDRYDDNRKIKRLWRRFPANPVGLHAMAITYCQRHATDGIVDIDWVEEKLPKQRERDAILDVLVKLRAFEVVDDEHWRVHDFLDYNPSRKEREAQSRGAKAAALARWGKRAAMRPACEPHTEPQSDADAQPNATPVPVVGEESPTTPLVEPHDFDTARDRLQTIEVAEVFDYWRDRCNHPNAKLTPDRSRKVRARLREGYTVQQLRQAIDGAAVGAFVNEAGQRFDALDLICRNGSKVEDFIGRATARPAPRPGRRESPSDLLRALDGAA